MARVRFQNASKTFRPTRTSELSALSEFTLEVGDGEYVAVLGPSGSGKTTVLRILAGLESLTGGELWIGDRSVRAVPPEQRNVAMVFQNPALYPQMTALENLTLGLRIRHVEVREAERRARALAGNLGLDAVLERYPAELSGGERQRVALGRALLREPEVLLLDEPLSSLDSALRRQLRLEIASAQRRAGVTTLHVTHDQEEAMAVADRIVILRAGRICQIADPVQLYRRPADVFVAGFVGAPAMNLWQGRVRGDGDEAVFELSGIVGQEGIRVRLPGGCGPGFAAGRDRDTDVVLGLRPEALRLVSAGPALGEGAEVVGKVVRVERLGADTILHFTLGTHSGTLRCAGDCAAKDGEEVRLRLELSQAHWFDAASGVRLTEGSG